MEKYALFLDLRPLLDAGRRGMLMLFLVCRRTHQYEADIAIVSTPFEQQNCPTALSLCCFLSSDKRDNVSCQRCYYRLRLPVSITPANRGLVVNPVRDTSCSKPSGRRNFWRSVGAKKDGSGEPLREPAFTKGAARINFLSARRRDYR